MNDPAVIAEQVVRLAGQLRIPAFKAKLKEYRRGGLPSSSLPDGMPRGSEPPLPLMDGVDRMLVETDLAVKRRLHEAWQALEEVVRRQNSVLIVAPAMEDDDVHLCETCSEPMVEQAKECSRCRKHRSRYDMAYPNVRDTTGAMRSVRKRAS